ncbi:hypothetical protein BCR33DRAFT_724768 [Rhizoclosmatium globosum]|uniref:Glycoside hydrolase n=1 Tax=Rhizoclosmatium globosum TaxID=329046 RepID=A0A1Y2B365_9FUNG|nr:hypothetical protein BCR33DRAFT_724768 [Rhizoclosmatium globosum]|eukprot:ORY29263.1 hypothetical protein BCR33DRAFT_724768 [Rhizoclosmatium globosum]
MHFSTLLLLLVPVQILCLAPLEPPTGKVHSGAWYDRNNSDTPKAINDRIGKKLRFFQTDIDLSGVYKPWTAPSLTDQFLSQLNDTGSNAHAYLTIYPFLGFDAITSESVDSWKAA